MIQKTFSLLSYNIHKGFGVGKLRFCLPKMRNAVEALDPDLMLLQEVQGRHDFQQRLRQQWPNLSQAEYLAENRWSYNIYGQNATYQNGHHGNAIISKFPLIASNNINVSNMMRASRGILHASFEDGSQSKIHLICVHLGLFREERFSQAETLSQYLSEKIPCASPLIVAGDFNDWREDLSHYFESAHQLAEAVKQHHGQYARSYPAIKPTLKVDRIYFRGLEVSEAGCLLGKPWRHLSDHLPVYARFRLP